MRERKFLSNGVKRPFLGLSLPFILGILIARSSQVPLQLLYSGGCFFLLFVVLSWRKKLYFYIFLLGSVLLGAASLYRISCLIPPNHVVNFAGAEEVILNGVVAEDPKEHVTSYGMEKLTFLLKAGSVSYEGSRYEVTGLVRTTVYGPGQRLKYGDELALSGKLIRPRGPGNPGEFDFSAHLARGGIYALLKVRDGENVILLRPDKGNPFVSLSLKAKQGGINIIRTTLPKPHSDILSAMLLGDRHRLSPEIKDLFIETGTMHILAISGLHVGLIALILIVIFKAVRIPRRPTYLLTAAALIFYALLTGGRAPVMRATIMASVILFGMAIRRDPDLYNSLALSALVILAARPTRLFDAGFQLSFVTVCAICYFTPKIEEELRLKGFLLGRLFAVSLAAWLGAVPLVAYHFNIFTPITILANLLVVPLLGVVMALGVATLFFGSIFITAGEIFASANWAVLVVLIKTISGFAKIPFGHLRVASWPIPFIVGYYGLLLGLFNYQHLRLSKKKVMVGLLLILNIFLWAEVIEAPSEDLRCTFLDVGEGDSIYLEFPGGGNMLIDGGEGRDYDQGRFVIAPYLWNKGIRRLDAVLLTHSDSDHVGGLITVLEKFKVGCVFDNGLGCESTLYKNYEEIIRRRKIPRFTLSAGSQIQGFGQAKVYILHPSAELLKSGLGPNDSSVVVKVTYGDVSFLLTGDIESEAIDEIVSLRHEVKVDVLTLPHHGDYAGEELEALLKSSRPSCAVISVGTPNRFGHPSRSTIELLDRLNIKTFRTDRAGAVQITTDGESYTIWTMRGGGSVW